MSTTLSVDEVPATIASGQSLSAPIQTNGFMPLWIETPAGLTGTTLTFCAVDAAGNDRVLRDTTGAELSLTIGAAGGRHSLMTALAAALAGHARIKVRAGTLSSPVAQGADRALTVGLRHVL